MKGFSSVRDKAWCSVQEINIEGDDKLHQNN